MIKFRFCKYTFLFISSFGVGDFALASATPFQITNRSSSLSASDPAQAAVLTALTQAADSMESTVNTGILSETSRQNFIDAVAKAHSSSVSSLLFDRSQIAEKWTVSVAGQGSFYSRSGSLSFTSGAFQANNSLPTMGGAAHLGLTFGIKAETLGLKSFAFLNPKRTFLYISGGTLDRSFDTTRIKLTHFGAGLQSHFFQKDKKSNVLNWGGVSVGTGLYYLENSATVTANLTQSSTVDVSGQLARINLNMNYALGIESNTFLIPIECSTSFRFLYVFTVFAGAGVDFNFGSTKLTGTATGPITASYSQNLGVGNLFSGTGSLNLDDGLSGKNSLVVVRGFAGFQLSLWKLNLITEGAMLTNGAVSLKAGIGVPI